MPKYIQINQDGSRTEVSYRIKDSLVMRQIRLDQAITKLDSLRDRGRITPKEHAYRISKIKRGINFKFSPALKMQGGLSPGITA